MNLTLPELPILNSAQRGRLTRGEVLVELSSPSAGLTRAVTQGVIEAPPERVWRLIDRVADYKRFMPSVVASRELSRDGERVRLQIEIGTPFPLKNLTSTTEGLHHVCDQDGCYIRAWDLVEGDYKQNRGFWALQPFDGDANRTWVFYQLEVQPRVKIPAKLQQTLQRKGLPKVVENLRREAR